MINYLHQGYSYIGHNCTSGFDRTLLLCQAGNGLQVIYRSKTTHLKKPHKKLKDAIYVKPSCAS